MAQSEPEARYIAIDLGASGGRVMEGRLAGGPDGPRLALRELHRFPNGPVPVLGHIHWDVLRLWTEVLAGLGRAAAEGQAPPASIGIDSWGVDFGLLDRDGQLIGNPYHYRDRRTAGVPERVDAIIPPARLYARTGIQRLPINTLYQLASLKFAGAAQIEAARTLLLMPDLFHYWLTGRVAAEYTNATTTNLLDAAAGRWAVDVIKELGLPAGILPGLVAPGSVIGEVLPAVRAAAGLPAGWAVPVVAVASHDTASAVAAVPGLDEQSAYISSGTWSLVGIEVDQPILTEQARRLNFTNEGGVAGTIRFLRNVAGLWLLQECRRRWAPTGRAYAWPELESLATAAPPLRRLIDPDAPEFLNPPDMPAAIRDFCRRTGQPEPMTDGEIARCCLESLALRYRWVLDALEAVAGRRIATVRVVGGGSQNRLLGQLTADASGRRVIAGPVEATALGNVLIQAVATAALPDLTAGRRAVAASVQLATFEPTPSAEWDRAYARFLHLVPPPH